MIDNPVVEPRTRFTTIYGGIGIVLASVLSLAVHLNFLTLLGSSSAFWFAAEPTIAAIISTVVPIILAVAVYILAFGVPAETGLIGDSRNGKIAVVVFSSVLIVKSVMRLFFIVSPGQLTESSVDVPGYVQLALGAIALVCLIVVVIVATRSGALNPVLLLGLGIVTAWTVLTAALWFIPIESILYFAITAQTIGIVLQIILGAAIALHGQSPALRRRAAIINEQW